MRLEHLENLSISPFEANLDHDYAKWYMPIDKKFNQCRKCGKICLKYQGIWEHLKYQHFITDEEAKFTCQICYTPYLEEWQLLTHIDKVHKPPKDLEPLIQCPKPNCKYKIRGEKRLEKHLKAHFLCNICGKSFGPPNNLESHMRHFHDETYFFRCTICPFVSKQKYHIDLHIKSHRMCDICGKDFSGTYAKRTFQRHMDIHNKNCSKCSINFDDVESLKAHFKSVHNRGNTLKKCPKCERTFKSYVSLKNHRKKVHGEVLDTSKQSELKRVIAEKDETITKCAICQVDFSDHKLLRLHLRSSHRGVRKVKQKVGGTCKYCGKKLLSLYQHENYTCEIRKLQLELQKQEQNQKKSVKITTNHF